VTTSPHAVAMGAADLDHCPLMPTYGAPTVEFVRGSGTELWDRDQKRYLDFLSGLAVTSLGHAHPEVAAAVAEQAGTLWHLSNLFANPLQADVALTLDRLLGGGGQIFFCNSGAEANECAIKLARRHGGYGRHQVISAFGSFHGRTLATLHATGQPAKHEVFQPLPEGFRHAVWNDAADIERQVDESVAAVLLEPVQGEGGVHPADPAFFADVRALCDERGLLLIVDEIQTGLGRTGRWFGFEHLGVRPDIVTMAKALGNGMPVGACWARREVAAAFRPGDHGSTFGGQPLALSAARAVLAVMERDDLPGRAARMGERLATGLLALDGVVGVRGFGLLLGAELAGGIDSRAVASAALAAGLVVNAVTPTTIRLAPPLTVSEAEVVEALDLLGAAIAAAGRGDQAAGRGPTGAIDGVSPAGPPPTEADR
jgi:acetylornithine/N-succinyldiaminopimelate aminotransferase